jgi:hypothetical protein
MPPVLPTERIAHLGTVDCCINPLGRYETIAVTPPIIFSKEVAQNRPPHFLARTSLSTRNRFTPNFQGWGLDENLKPKSPPYRGAHIDVRWQDKNEVGLAARAAMLRARSGASILHSDHGACGRCSLYDCARNAYKLNSRATAGKVYPHEIGIQETRTNHRKLDS